jgi:adenine-specific DNA-methyltransferase
VGLDRELISAIKSRIEKPECNEQDVNWCNDVLQLARSVSLAEFFRTENVPKAEQEKFKWDNAWRIIQAVGSSSVFAMAKRLPQMHQDIAAGLSSTSRIYLYKTDFDPSAKQPRVQVLFADDNLMRNPGDFWQDIKTTGGVGQEGGVLFPNGKKPEALLRRVIGMCTKKGDLVLDSFGGSGTTGAVAHKMGRRWIMVELGDQCFTHIVPRLKSVIDGTDRSGVTEVENWRGGGGFRYFRLASSLLEKDAWGNWIISKEFYNPAMLAEAVCKLMGFVYQPDETRYWMQGRSSETDFIYVTTQSLTHEQLAAISEEVGDDRTLLVCCKAFRGNPDAFPNLTIKKIPQAVLRKCEWGKDDYSLNVANLPEATAESDTPQAPSKSGKKKNGKAPSQDDLFGQGGSK